MRTTPTMFCWVSLWCCEQKTAKMKIMRVLARKQKKLMMKRRSLSKALMLTNWLNWPVCVWYTFFFPLCTGWILCNEMVCNACTCVCSSFLKALLVFVYLLFNSHLSLIEYIYKNNTATMTVRCVVDFSLIFARLSPSCVEIHRNACYYPAYTPEHMYMIVCCPCGPRGDYSSRSWTISATGDTSECPKRGCEDYG